MKKSYPEALEMARALAQDLEPVCARVEIAGSLRRQRPWVHDIEIVCEPLAVSDLFGEGGPDIERIRTTLALHGKETKGGDRYIQISLHDQGIHADVFMCHPPANWWVLLAIRTGPWQLNRAVMTRMNGFGYQCEQGRVLIRDTRREATIESEDDFFACANMRCLAPTQRDAWEASIYR